MRKPPAPSPTLQRATPRRGRLPLGELQRRLRRLLKVAREEFAKNGFGGTSLDRLVARSGVSKTTIIRHFGSKEGLFQILIDQMMAAIHSELAAVRFETATPHRALTDFIDAYTRAAVLNPSGHMLLGIAMLEGRAFPHLGDMILSHAKDGLQPASAFIARLMDEGRLEPADPMEAVFELQGMMTHGFRVFVEDSAFLTRPGRAAEIATRFLKGRATDFRATDCRAG